MKTTRQRFKDYDKLYFLPDSDIIIPPFLKKKIASLLKGDILDIGCADGHKLKKLLSGSNSSKIRSIDAIEPSPLYKKAVRIFKNSKKVRVFHKEVKEILLYKKRYDIIMLYEVIEHVPSPENTIRVIKKLLKPGGLLILSTPNRLVYHILCKLKGEKVDPTHVSEMSYRELRKLMNKNFKKNEFIGFFPLMFIIRKFPFLDIVNIIFRYLKCFSRTIYSFSSD